jgi:hypothetical protein
METHKEVLTPTGTVLNSASMLSAGVSND